MKSSTRLPRSGALPALVLLASSVHAQSGEAPASRVFPSLHGIELHPEYDRNGWSYIAYTEGEEVHSTAVIDRFRLAGEVVAEERLAPRLLGRIRSITVDAAGLVYLGSDSGEVWRLRPQ